MIVILKHELFLVSVLIVVVASLFVIQLVQPSPTSWMNLNKPSEPVKSFVELPSIQSFQGTDFEQEQLARIYYFINGYIPANTPLIKTDSGWVYQKVIV